MSSHRALPRLRALALLVAAGCALGLVPGRPAAAESTGPTPRQLVSRIGSAGVRQSEIGPGRTDPGSVNGDGDVIAFTTPANGPGDTNGTADVYVRDRRAGTTTLVSGRPGGGAGSLGGRVPSISTDGRYVSFVSESPDLVAGDTGVTNDVFVRDRVTGTTTRVNIQGGARVGTPITAVISPDGKVVAWQGSQGIWVRSWRTSTTVTRVLTGTSASLGISLSGDGRYLAHVDTDGAVVRRDLTTTGADSVVAVSATSGGARRTGRSPSIDLEGTVVAFLSDAPDIGGSTQEAGPTRLWTRRLGGADPGFGSIGPPITAYAMSSTGIAFAFVTTSSLVAEDTDDEPDVYALNVNLGGATRLVSEALPPTPSTAPGRLAWNPEISGDGMLVTVVSSAVATGSGSTVAEPRRWAVAAIPRTAAERSSLVSLWFDAAYGRAPSATERSAGEAATASLAETDYTLLRSYLRAPAWAEPRGLVVRLYEAYYLRPPDLAGYDYWVGRRLAGMTPEAMSAAFSGTPEFRTMYGTLTNRQFVDRVYLNVLRRAASPADLAYWTGELDAGRRTRGQVMLAFSETAENRARTAVRVDVVLLVRTAKERIPTRAELDDIDDDLARGWPPSIFALLAL